MDFLRNTNLISALLLAAAFLFLVAGLRAILLGRKTIYFRHRRQRVIAGWWLIFAALLLAAIGWLTYRPGIPFFVPAARPPTAVPVPTRPAPTVTRVPSRTPRPTQTAVVAASSTLAPQLPISIQAMSLGTVTPRADAGISDVQFSTELDHFVPVNPSVKWRNPIRRMFATFKYRNMTPGAQWFALWFRDGGLVFIDTRLWDRDEKGRSFSFWEPAPHEWLPGEYEVQIFVGMEWKATGRFTLTGKPTPATPTPTLTFTPRPTRTPSFTPTPLPTPR